jgi:hypothetical protein
MKRKITAGIIAAVALLTLTGCGNSTQSGQRGVIADGAMFPVSPALIDCMEPEKYRFSVFDTLYSYPARQISWDASGGEGSERDPYKVVSNRSAPAELTVPTVVTMELTSNCELLKEFHRELGTKYDAWLDEDGTTSDGWIKLLDYVVGQPTDVTLVRVAQKYPWQEIWNDEAIRLEFEKTLATDLPERIKERSKGKEFFTNIQVTVGKPDPVDQKLKDAISGEQTKIAEANASRLAAEAQKETAIAETEVARQRALQKQADIAGFPSVEDYLKYQCIEGGCNPYQPTYVVPQSAAAK